jgi:hypothetical protein
LSSASSSSIVSTVAAASLAGKRQCMLMFVGGKSISAFSDDDGTAKGTVMCVVERERKSWRSLDRWNRGAHVIGDIITSSSSDKPS